MSANPNANQNFESSQFKSFASLDNAINPDARAANTPAVLRAENQDAKSLTKENIEKDLSSEYGNEFDVQQPYGDEFDVEGTEVINNEKIEHEAQPENSEGGSSSSTEGEGDDKPLRPGGMVPGQAKAEPNTYVNADKESKKSGLTRRDGTTLPGTSGSSAGDLTAIFCNVTIEYAKDQNVTYSNTTGGGTKGKESAEALGNSLNETSEDLATQAGKEEPVEPLSSDAAAIQDRANNTLGGSHNNPDSKAYGLNSKPPVNLQNNNREAAEAIAYITDGYNTDIYSGYRNPAYNAAVGGAKNSMHLQNRAIDFGSNIPRDVFIKRVGELRSQGYNIGYGIYSWGYHVDNGPNRNW